MYGISVALADVKTLSRETFSGRGISMLRMDIWGRWDCISFRMSQLEISSGSPFKCLVKMYVS